MSNYLTDRRIYLGLTQKDVADYIGVSEGTVSRWESGAIANMRRDRINLYAKILKCSANFIMTGTVETAADKIPPGFDPVPETDEVPRAGNIACGEPITAEQNIVATDRVPKMWHADFTLKCRGDSMLPRIEDGDVVAIHIQPCVENGEIAAVCIGDEATLKHVYLHDDYIELRPENPEYQSIIRSRTDMNDVKIEGKAVGLCRGL